MENQMGFFQKFKNALYNTEAYVSFLNQGLGKGILYIFILSVILGGIVSIKTAYGFSKVMTEVSSWSYANIPSFSLQDGELFVDAPMPIIYEESGTIFLVDTENPVDVTMLDGYEQGFLISATEMYGKKSTGEIRMIKFSDFEGNDEIVLTGVEISHFLDTCKGIGVVVIIICGILFCFAGKLISLFIIMGVGGLITGAIVHCKTDYETSCKLGAYALTAPMLIKFILSLIGLQVPYFFILYYGISLVYVGRALKAVEVERIISDDTSYTS